MKFSTLPRGVPGTSMLSGTAPRALWMDLAVLRESPFWQYEAGKIVLGAAPSSKSDDSAMPHLIGVQDNRHIMTVAGSRAGKGVSAIIPNLLTYSGSVVVIDPKGENAEQTAERRGQGRGIPAGGMGHDVYVIDPFRVANVADEYRAGFNPFAALDPDSNSFIDDCDGIADGLVMSEPGKGSAEGDHWINAARMVLRGFIAWVAVSETVRSVDLNELRRLLFLPPDDTPDSQGFDALLVDMSLSEIAHGIPAEAANTLLGMGSRERGSVLSTVRNNIQFLSSPPMAAALSGNMRSIDLSRWKHGGASVYLCLPAGRLHTHSRFFRLFLNRLLAAVEQDKAVPEIPALILMDEMHVLGRMAALETAAGLLAGYGVRLWSIWQDMSQLKDLYKDRWETFMGNSGILQFFGVNDLTTSKYISERLGISSVVSINNSEISEEQVSLGFTGKSASIQAAPLLSPDEVGYFFSRQSGNQLIFYPGADPIFAHRVPYWHEIYEKVRMK